MVLPPGMAKRVPAGWRLVFVVHYSPIGTAQTDRTRLGLTFAPASAVRQEVATRLLYDPDLLIPPHAPNHRVEQTWRARRPAPAGDVPPHAPRASRSATRPPIPTGRAKPCSYVPRYDFNWQHRYVLATPSGSPPARPFVHRPLRQLGGQPGQPRPGATVRTGKQSTDEMFNGYFDVALADQDLLRPALRWPSPSPRPLAGSRPCSCPVGLRARLASRPSRPRMGQTDTPSLNRKSDLCRISRRAGHRSCTGLSLSSGWT